MTYRSRVPLVLAVLLLSASPLWAVDKTWTGATSTVWATGSNWTPAGAPGAADRAIIPAVVASGRMPVVDAFTTIDQLQVFGTVTINTGITVTVDGGASPFIDGTGTVLTPGTGLLSVNNGATNAVLVNNSITLGNFRLTAVAGRDYIVASGRTVTVNGTLTVNQGNLVVGVAAGAASTLDVSGDVVVNANASLVMRAPNDIVRVGGNWTQAGVFTSGTGSTVIFDGGAAQTVAVTNGTTANVSFENLRISNTAALVTYAANGNLATGFIILGNLTVDGGADFRVQEAAVVGTAAADTLGIGSGATLTFTARLDPDCTIAFDIDGGAQDGQLILQGTTLPPADTSDFGFALRAGRGQVRIEVTNSQTLPLTNGGPYSFWDLVVQTDTGGGQVDADIITTTAAFTVLNDLVLTRCQFQMAAVAVNVFGDVISGPNTQSQLDFTGAGTLQVRGNVDLGSISQVTSGVNGPFATIYMVGTTPQTFQIRATTASQYHDLDALRVGNPAGVTVLNNPNADFTVNGQLLIDANALLTVQDVFDPESPLVFAAGGGNVLRLENIISPDSTIMGSTFTTGTGTVVYAGAAVNQIVYTQQNNGTQIQYYNLTIDNSGSVATQQAPNTLRVLGTFTILGAGSSFTSSANGMLVSQSFIANGTFTHANSTVTLNGTGAIGGTSAGLTFFNLTVDGAAADTISAARGFTTANNFLINQGRLTTAGIAAPIAIDASLGLSAGNGAGGAGTADLDLVGPVTLSIGSARTFVVNGADGRFTALATPAGTPTLTRSGAGTFTATVNGQANLYGLNFGFADAAGLNFGATATLERLRNVRFTNVNATAGSRHVTIAAANLNLDCPGCYFGPLPAGAFNVQARGAATNIRLRFEDRGPLDPPAGQGIGGPGAGDAGDNDDDANSNGILTDAGETATGSIVQWVYTANIDMVGAIQGAPTPAFDWNTFSYYSTYVVMNQGLGSPDTIYVLDGEGDVAYSFSPGLPAGNIAGMLFWDTEGANHVVYFGTTTGLVYKLIDNGSALAPPAPPSPWSTPFSHSSLQFVSTAIMSDQTNLYFGGNDNLSPGNSTSHWGLYRVVIATKTMPIGEINLQRAAVLSDSSWADTAGGRMVFQAAGQATNGTSSIYRVRTTNWTIDTQVNGTSAFTGPTNVPLDTLFVGEFNGRIHAVAALGTAAQFVNRPGFPFTVNTNAVTGGVIWDNTNVARLPALTGGRLFFGTGSGEVFVLYLYPAAWVAAGPTANYYRLTPPGAAAVQTQPLVQGGILYVSNSGGRLHVYDADTGAGPSALPMTTYTLFGNAATGDISRDSIGSGRIYVGTGAGRVYAIPPPADPTGAFP